VGVFLVYSLGDDGVIAGGPEVATLSGWLAFLDWAEPLSDFPALSNFAQECTAWSAEEIDRLEAELSGATRAHAASLTAETLLTVGRLLEAIHGRPGGTVAMVASDGCDGEDDDDQDADEDLDKDEDNDDDADEDEESAEGRPGPATPAPQADPGEGLETGMPTPAAGAATPAQLRAAQNRPRLTGEPPSGGWQNDTRERLYEAGYSQPAPDTPAPDTQPEPKPPLEWPAEWGPGEITF
jgi:hypothetical protein